MQLTSKTTMNTTLRHPILGDQSDSPSPSPRISSGASNSPTTSAQGRDLKTLPEASPTPTRPINGNASINTMNEPKAMDSQLSIVSKPSLTLPNHEVLIALERHHFLMRFMQKLVPVLKDLNLIGKVYSASVITSICRNHRSRMLDYSMKALELAERIMEYAPVIVDGVEITATIDTDQNTGRLAGFIGLAWSSNFSNTPFVYHKKSPEQVWLAEERSRIWQKRRNKRYEREQNRLFNLKVRELENRPREAGTELDEPMKPRTRVASEYNYPEDPDLMDYLTSLMPKSGAEN